MSPNDLDGMTNSVDPDQTAPLGLIWVYTVCLDLSRRISQIDMSRVKLKRVRYTENKIYPCI